MAEPSSSSLSAKLPSAKDAKANFDDFKRRLKNGESPLDDSWELLVNASVKRDHLRAWRKPEVRE